MTTWFVGAVINVVSGVQCQATVLLLYSILGNWLSRVLTFESFSSSIQTNVELCLQIGSILINLGTVSCSYTCSIPLHRRLVLIFMTFQLMLQNVMKLGHNKRSADAPDSTRRPIRCVVTACSKSMCPMSRRSSHPRSMLCRKYREWQCGVGLFAVGNVLNFVSFGALLAFRLQIGVKQFRRFDSCAALELCLFSCRVCRTIATGCAWLHTVRV